MPVSFSLPHKINRFCSQSVHSLVGETDKYINSSDLVVCDSSVMEMTKTGTLREDMVCPGGQGSFLREGAGVSRKEGGKGLSGRKSSVYKRSLSGKCIWKKKGRKGSYHEI